MSRYPIIVLLLCAIVHLSCSQTNKQKQGYDLRINNPMFDFKDDNYYIFNHLQLNKDTLSDIIISAVYKEEYQRDIDKYPNSRAYFFLINQRNDRYLHTKTIRKGLGEEGVDEGGQQTSFPGMINKSLVFKQVFYKDYYSGRKDMKYYSFYYLLNESVNDWILDKVVYEECEESDYERNLKLKLESKSIHRGLVIGQNCQTVKELKINKVIKVEDVGFDDYYDKMK